MKQPEILTYGPKAAGQRLTLHKIWQCGEPVLVGHVDGVVRGATLSVLSVSARRQRFIELRDTIRSQGKEKLR